MRRFKAYMTVPRYLSDDEYADKLRSGIEEDGVVTQLMRLCKGCYYPFGCHWGSNDYCPDNKSRARGLSFYESIHGEIMPRSGEEEEKEG